MSDKRDEAFTGLEAAIVLIAFVVVAAVFANVVLGAGFFASQKSQETVSKGVEQASSNIQMVGQVYGIASTPSAGINEIRLAISLAPGASSVDLSKMQVVFSTGSTAPVTLTQTSSTTPSTTQFTTLIDGVTPTDTMAGGQQVQIDFMVAPVSKSTTVNIEVRPAIGAALPFSRDTPATIQTSNILY